MPQLKILNENGRLAKNAFAETWSAMHFPLSKQHDEREKLRSFCVMEDYFKYHGIEDGPEGDDEFYPEEGYASFDNLIKMRKARSLRELLVDDPMHFRDGFLAGHWLTYQIFAHQHRQLYPELHPSTNGWMEYVGTYLLPKLIEEQTERFGVRPRKLDDGRLNWHWLTDIKSLKRAAVDRFWPVAHLWAAATYNPSFRERLILEDNISSIKQPVLTKFLGSLRPQFFSLAAGLFDAAQRAGVYARRGGAVHLNGVWTIPVSDDYVRSNLEIVHPDKLLQIAFEKIRPSKVQDENSLTRTIRRSEMEDLDLIKPAPRKVRIPDVRAAAEERPRHLPFGFNYGRALEAMLRADREQLKEE